jgi:hypothetical protein
MLRASAHRNDNRLNPNRFELGNWDLFVIWTLAFRFHLSFELWHLDLGEWASGS